MRLIPHTKDLTFAIEPADNLEKVVITEITFLSYDKTDSGILFSDVDDNKTIIDALQTLTGKQDLSQCGIVYTGAEFTFCFESKGNENCGCRVAVKFTYPNRIEIPDCDDCHKQIINDYLKRLIPDESTDISKQPTTYLNQAAAKLGYDLCETQSKIIAHCVLPMLGSSSRTLSHLNYFSQGFKAKNPKTYIEGRPVKLRVNEQNTWGYEDKQQQWHEVPTEEVIQYQFNTHRFIDTIRDDLTMSLDSAPETLVDDRLWYLGQLHLRWWYGIPVFFANRVAYNPEQADIKLALEKRLGFKQGIILTTTKSVPPACSFPGDHHIISLFDCMVPDSDQFHINTNHFQALFHDTIENSYHFSSNYRHVVLGEKEFEFTKMCAEIVKILHQKKGKIHKDTLLRMVGSEQTDLKALFRKDNGYHDAIGTLIKCENGHYRLDY